MLLENISNISTIDEKADEKEGEEKREIYNFHLDKRENIMKSTKIPTEDVFGNF